MDKKYTDEDVNCLLNRKYARWQNKIRKVSAETERLVEINDVLLVRCEDLQDEIDELRSKQVYTRMLAEMIRKGTACSNQ